LAPGFADDGSLPKPGGVPPDPRVGGLSAARALLLSLIARVQEFSHQLGALPALDLASYQQAVTDGENAMNDARRWDDMIEQRDYLEARQDLLEQEITAELRTRVSELAGRYLASTREVLAVVDSWRGTLEVVREHAIAGRNAVDAARRAANASPVQRYLPLPGDAVEQELWQDCYGTPGEGLAAGLRQCLETVSWSLTLEEAPPKKIRFATPAQQNRDGGMSLEVVLGVTARPFASLRTRSVWEMLERAGTDAGELVAELASRGSPLSVFNPNGQQDVAGNLRQFRDSNYVFTGWLEERADAAESVRGAALSRAVRARLGEREVHTEPLDTLRNPPPCRRRTRFWSSRPGTWSRSRPSQRCPSSTPSTTVAADTSPPRTYCPRRRAPPSSRARPSTWRGPGTSPGRSTASTPTRWRCAPTCTCCSTWRPASPA